MKAIPYADTPGIFQAGSRDVLHIRCLYNHPSPGDPIDRVHLSIDVVLDQPSVDGEGDVLILDSR